MVMKHKLPIFLFVSSIFLVAFFCIFPADAFTADKSLCCRASTGASMSSSLSVIMTTEHLLFSKFKIPLSHVFYRSPLSAAIVNLRPIVPGHVLVISNRVIPRISELSEDEYIDLWATVRLVQGILTKHYNVTGFNVAIQDGRTAGQSVPHVHVHILPRTEGDFPRNDDVYDALQEWAPREEMSAVKSKLHVQDDEERKDRTFEQMVEEATLYQSLL